MSKGKKRNSARGRIIRLLKWLIPLAIIAGLIVLAMKEKPIEVDTGSVISGLMQVTVDDDGETRVRERYTISAPLAGSLLRMALEPGDVVKKNAVLATIVPAAPDLLDPRSVARAEAAVRAGGAAVTSAATQLEARGVEADQLKKAFERNQLLHENGNVADAAFEEIESAYLAANHARAAAGSAVEIAQFELEQAKAALLRFDGDPNDTPSGFEIRAPIDGRVLVVEDKSARMVQAGHALLELGDPGQLEIRIDVLSQDAVQIRAGQQIIIEHWGGEQALAGRVRRIEPSAYTKVSALGVDEQRVDVIADFEGEAPNVGDGYRVEARIVVWEKPDAVQIPAGALFRQGDEWAAYKIDGESAHLSLLELGKNNGEFAEVISGVIANDRVILHPGDRIADGTLIQLRQ